MKKKIFEIRKEYEAGRITSNEYEYQVTLCIKEMAEPSDIDTIVFYILESPNIS